MGETQLSQAAYDRLRAEYEDLTTRWRVEIAQKIERARELGDLTENGDYQAAKEEQGMKEARIRQLQALLDSAVVADAPPTGTSVANGSVVSLRYEGDDEAERYLIGSIEERHDELEVISPGWHLELPGRGTTFVRDLPGPPGAPVLVLLHGLSATADLNWFPSFFPLGRHFRVVAIDHRGHGRGIRSARRFRLSDCADDVAAMADVLAIDRFIPVGYSMGGPVAQLLWKRHTDRVGGLVLCATSRNFGGRPPERAFFSMLPFVSAAARMTPAPVWRGFTGRG